MLQLLQLWALGLLAFAGVCVLHGWFPVWPSRRMGAYSLHGRAGRPED